MFDLHCDTALSLLGKDLAKMDSLRSNQCMIDLSKAQKLQGYCQCFACFTTPEMQEWYKKSPIQVFELELAAILNQIEKNNDLIRLTYRPDDIERNYHQGIMSAVLSIEGPAGFDYDPSLLEDLYRIGFRISTLGWNESNILTGSHISKEGLSDVGKEYVREAQRLGILIDVSHISDHAFWDIMEISKAPIIASHSNSRSVCQHSRNLTDDMFSALCQSGGLVGINLYRDFIGNNGNLDAAVDHVLHFLNLDPTGKHIALGGDLDGCDSLVEGISNISDYPKFAHKLIERGVSQDTVLDIFWNNALGVMKHAVCNNEK